MKISTRYSDSIHILAFLSIYQGQIPLTSNNIASSVETSPVVVRRLMNKTSYWISNATASYIIMTKRLTPNVLSAAIFKKP